MGEKIIASVASTRQLANGFRHSREGLQALAIAMERADPYMRFDHRLTEPIAKVLRTWVDKHERDEDGDEIHHALYVEFEVLNQTDTDLAERARRWLEGEGGMSISFFGESVQNFHPSLGQGDISIGISVELGFGDIERSALVNRLSQASDSKIAVKNYHQHALTPETAIVLVLGGKWLIDKVGGKVFDELWDWAKNLPQGKQPKRIKMRVPSKRGIVLVEAPFSPDQLKFSSIATIAVDLAEQEEVNPDGRAIFSVVFDEDFNAKLSSYDGAWSFHDDQ